MVSGAGQGPASAAEGAADDWAPPVLTSPAPDTQTGGTAEFTATSESPYVVFELGPAAGPIVRRTPVAADEDGVFRDALPTVGIGARFAARVRACADASVESCTTVSAAVPVRGLLPQLRRSAPWSSWVVDPTVVSAVSLRATDLGGHPATVSGAVPRGEVRDGDLVDVDVSAISSADLLVSLQQCSPLNDLVCTRTGVELTVRTGPNLSVSGSGLFVSPNGDGLWGTATSHVQLDADIPVTARWRVLSTAGRPVAGPFEFSSGELDAATRPYQWAAIVIDLRKRLARPLPSGEYRFEVETTATVTGFTKSTRKSVPLAVSDAPPVTRLTPTTRFFYPFAAVSAGSGVPTTMRMSPALDPYEVKFGGYFYRILRSDGRPLGGSTELISVRDALTWNGYYWRDGLHVPAPAGTYRIELVRTPPCVGGVCERVYGPVSAPFTLRDGTPDRVNASVAASARSTWRRTVVKRGAKVHRVKGGAVRFTRKAGRQGAAKVTTLHSVRVPADRERDSWFPSRVRLRGAWGNTGDLRVAVVTPKGRTLRYQSPTRSRRYLDFEVHERWVRSDGQMRFKVRWKGKKPARLDRFVVTYSRYDLSS